MKLVGPLLLAIVIGIVAIWLLLQLLGFALQVVAIGVGILLAVFFFLVVERLVGKGR